MKCSTCGSSVAPVVVVDIDGTIGNYHDHFVAFAEKYLDQELPGDYTGFGEFSEFLGIEKSIYRDIKLAYRQGAQKRSMPMIRAADTFIKILNDRGIEVWFATTRPYLRLDNVDPDTRFWLAKHDMEYRGLIYDEHKYELLLQHVDKDRVLCVIDDLPQSLWEADDFGLNAWQPNRRWNADEPWGRRFDEWEIMDHIVGWQADWEERFRGE